MRDVGGHGIFLLFVFRFDQDLTLYSKSLNHWNIIDYSTIAWLDTEKRRLIVHGVKESFEINTRE